MFATQLSSAYHTSTDFPVTRRPKSLPKPSLTGRYGCSMESRYPGVDYWIGKEGTGSYRVYKIRAGFYGVKVRISSFPSTRYRRPQNHNLAL